MRQEVKMISADTVVASPEAPSFDREIKQWYNLCVETTIRLLGQKIRQLWMDDWLTLEEAAIERFFH